jgi:hypothetical protein
MGGRFGGGPAKISGIGRIRRLAEEGKPCLSKHAPHGCRTILYRFGDLKLKIQL